MELAGWPPSVHPSHATGMQTDDGPKCVRALEALDRSERRFQELVESLDAIVWEAHAVTFAFQYVSPYATTLLGYPLEDWIGSSHLWSRLIRPMDRREAILSSPAWALVAETHEFDHEAEAADGRRVWLRNRVHVARDPEGRPLYLRGVMVDITERKMAEEALRASEARLQHLMTSSPGVAFSLAPEPPHACTFVSPNVQAQRGYAAAQYRQDASLWTRLVHPDDRPALLARLADLTQRGSCAVEYRYRHQDGRYRWLRDELALVPQSPSGPPEILGFSLDITERKELEDQLRQAQKMEAIGRLAGGLAHDFNNMLAVISGYSDLLLAGRTDDDPLYRSLIQIRRASERATGLTRQLLAFSRKQIVSPRVLDLGQLMESLHAMLRRLIGEDIELVTLVQPGLQRVLADPGQLEQLLLNLAVNARDAMSNGGTLTLTARNARLGPDFAATHPLVAPGEYVLLTVADTGTGMDAETQAHAFEPFFTTKSDGKGTGLGLATVYAITRQSGGHVELESQLGAGTTFRVYLPACSGQADAADPGDPADVEEAAPAQAETVLLVEDESMVRGLVRTTLETSGYRVLEAIQGDEAIALCTQHTGPIHLLLTDVVMPRMSGRELSERIQALRPETRVLFMSGYTDDAIVTHGVRSDRLAFLAKPFSNAALLRKVREVLDQPLTSVRS